MAGLVSRRPVPPPEPVPGGILADEMGLGESQLRLELALLQHFACSEQALRLCGAGMVTPSICIDCS